MGFTNLRKAGFDTETTGPDPDTARIVTAALVVRGGNLPDIDFTWLINPGVPIPDEAIAIHGITTERAQAEGQDPKAALDDIASKLTAALRARMPVIAFNLGFDWTVLDRDLARHGLPSMAERLHPLAPVTLLIRTSSTRPSTSTGRASGSSGRLATCTESSSPTGTPLTRMRSRRCWSWRGCSTGSPGWAR